MNNVFEDFFITVKKFFVNKVLSRKKSPAVAREEILGLIINYTEGLGGMIV